MPHWYIFHEQKLLLCKHSDGTYSIPCASQSPISLENDLQPRTLHISAAQPPVMTVSLSQPFVDTDTLVMMDLRESYHLLPSADYLAAGKCREILYWDSQTQYCGHCGTPMSAHTEISKKCPSCGREAWPLLAIAVIVLVRRGDQALLVKAQNFRRDYYGLVAGFVETGENLEEAVAREVLEETGVRINNIRYFASQPWPYPCGLMVGFYADYVSEEIEVQQEELKTAGWFSRDALPPIPGKMSIARQLIDNWLDKG